MMTPIIRGDTYHDAEPYGIVAQLQDGAVLRGDADGEQARQSEKAKAMRD